LNIVQLGNDAAQIANTVIIGIGKGTGINLVDCGGLPPGKCRVDDFNL